MNRFLPPILILYISLLPFILSGQNNKNPQIPTSTSFVFKKPITPHPSIEAEAQYRHSQSTSGEKILSEKMYSPNGIKDAEYIQSDTGKEPEMRGIDLKGFNFGAKSGNYTIQNDRIKIVAKGEGFDGKRDDGYFVFKQITGDFDVSAQVLSLSPTHMQTSTGIMARADLRRSSAYTYIQVFPENNPNESNPVGCQFSSRAKRGAQTEVIIPEFQTANSNFKVKFPITWISLQRRGDTFISYISNDNILWHIYSVQKQKMPKSILVGLAISSANSEKSATAEFKPINLPWGTKIKDEKTK